MTGKTQLMIPLFERFIKESYQGKRTKADGSRVKEQTIRNYEYVLRYLQDYEQQACELIRIQLIKNRSQRLFMAEKKYWRKFYAGFTQYLYKEKNCYDNYVGTVIKTIRIFFNWLQREKGINTGEFYKSFYVCKEEVPIVTLVPDRLQLLMNNKEFDSKLNVSLRKAKSIFIFGCTVGLRVSDLFNIRFTDIEKHGEMQYLPVKTQKTGAIVRIKLPQHAIDIVENFRLTAKNRKTVFPPVPRTRFNNQLKEIAELAGWTEAVGKQRSKKGISIDIKKKGNNTTEREISKNDRVYRFCDLVSSHTMRRTAITTMLMMGMKEHVVKQISGHAGNSKSFHRYVNLVQPFMDEEMDKVFSKLAG